MPLYKQPNDWQCGPFALKHALLVLGRIAHEERLTRLAGATRADGADERALARAAAAHRADLGLVRHTAPGDARRALAAYLRESTPVLLCVDGWNHWLTAAADLGDAVAVFDSARDPVLDSLAWDALLSRVAYRPHGGRRGDLTWFDLHPVVLHRPPSWRLNLTVERFRTLATSRSDLARHWDRHMRILQDVAAPRGERTAGAVGVADWLRKERPAVVADVLRHRPFTPPLEVERALNDLGFVAGMFGMTTDADPPQMLRRAVRAVITLLPLELGVSPAA